MTSLLEKFNLNADLFSAVVNEPELFEGSGTSTMLRVGSRTPYSASINGVAIPAYVTVREAALTRLSLLNQVQASSGRSYNLVTGIMKPVKMDIELVIDGETITLVDLLHKVAIEATKKEISRDEFVHSARRIGLNFADGMPLFFQQFGASEAGYKSAVEILRKHGATDTAKSMNNRGRIQSAWQMPNGASIPVTAFELGSVDRTKSARYAHDGVGQGFLNLVEAQVEQFTRIIDLRKSAKINEAKQAEAAQNGADQADIKLMGEQIKTLRDMSRQWASNWAGAQRRLEMQKNGTFMEQNTYDPVNAPCGRFTLADGADKVEIDLWTNSLQANTSAGTIATSNTDEDDDDVF